MPCDVAPCILTSLAYIQYLAENLGALNLKLTSEDVAEVRRLAEAAQGTLDDRYPAAAMKLLLAETPALQ